MLPLQTAGVSPSLASLEPFFLYFKFTRIYKIKNSKIYVHKKT